MIKAIFKVSFRIKFLCDCVCLCPAVDCYSVVSVPRINTGYLAQP